MHFQYVGVCNELQSKNLVNHIKEKNHCSTNIKKKIPQL